MKVWEAFRNSRRLRIICFSLAGILLVASIVGLWRSSSAPQETGIPAAGYQHTGKFDYTVYLKPNSLYGSSVVSGGGATQQEASLLFFRDIIDNARLAFSYKFGSSGVVTDVTNDVVVTIIAESPGLWSKEMKQLEGIYEGKEFRVDFPLDLDALDNVVAHIEQEIGVGGSQPKFHIKATVHTIAQTAAGKTIEADFSHEIVAILKGKTLELQGSLEGSGTGTKEMVAYTQEGWFDYEIYLKPNTLYEERVLRSEGLPVAGQSPSPQSSAQTLGPGLTYFTKIIDSIQASFSYRFMSDSLVTKRSEEVQITAIIENPGSWSKTLVLVPVTAEQGDFSISFPIDVGYFSKLISAIQQETGASASKYNIKIKADVHTIAQTDMGSVNEVYSQTMEGELGGNTLTLGKGLSQSKSGYIGGGAAPVSSGTGGLKAPWLAGLIVALIALGYFGWNEAQLRIALKPAISAVDAEAARVKKKYRQVIMDIKELPEIKPNETVIPVSSLDDLVRIADDLVKPVLHKAEEKAHIYCVVDGTVRYQYVIQPQQ